MDQAAAKQQIVERIKQANNILVTVSNNPSVDQLAACIGLTLLLNKMEKHATAVFSGQPPSTIEFLQPEKTIETNTDSLQDFIISLDKNKADKLRYKVENDVVRIFITPYKTSLSEKDLVFSQGDFNVEVVIALGVKERSQLDAAITAHGRILHDATVISVNAGNDKAADLGQINWQEPSASSLSEMLVSISEAFGPGLIDNQVATAFLTGIVAETARFSNGKTSPKVMTMSAQLMAAGANQQLIVSKLEPPKKPLEADKLVAKKEPPPSKPPASPPAGVLSVSHAPEENDSPEVEVNAGEIRIDEHGNIVSGEAEAQLAAPQQPLPEPKPEPTSEPVPEPTPELELEPLPKPPEPPRVIKSTIAALDVPVKKDFESKVKQDAELPLPGPHTLLDPSEYQPTISPPFTADTQPPWYDPASASSTDPLSATPGPTNVLAGRNNSQEPPELEILPSSAKPVQASLTEDSARSAVQNALDAVPFDSANHPIKAIDSHLLTQELHPRSAPVSLNPPPPVPPPLMPSPRMGQNKPK